MMYISAVLCVLASFLAVSNADLKSPPYDSDPCYYVSAPGVKNLLSAYMQTQVANGTLVDSVLESNFLVSPLALSMALLLIYPGTNAATEVQLTQALFHKDDPKSVNLPICPHGLNPFGVIGEDFAKAVNASIIYKALFDSGIKLKPEYVTTLKSAYGVDAAPAEIVGTERKLNHELQSATHERVNHLLDRGSFTNDTRLVLISAAYFKGEWFSKFQDQQTTEGKFFDVNRSNPKPAKFMTTTINEAVFGTISHDNITFLELPYHLTDFKLVLFKGLNKLLIEKGFNFRKKLFSHKEDKREEQSGKVVVKLPKFTFTTTTMDMRPALEALGVVDLFDSQKADITGVTTDRSIVVNAVFQKSFVKIAENGTEVTSTAEKISSTPPPTSKPDSRPPLEFLLDEPFAFVVVHTPTEHVLFEGYVADPQAEERH